MSGAKTVVDWELVEKHYRAGLLSNVQIAKECNVTEGAIRKRAKRDLWSKDLQPKIKARAEELVRREAVREPSTSLTPVSEKQVVEENAKSVASADLVNRADVILALSVSRGQLEEVAAMSNPEVMGYLEDLGDLMDTSVPGKPDKANELYRYIISLAGRVKMSKEIAAAHGVYIPMQRKILKLDEEGDKNQSNLDALLAKINAAAD